MRKIGNFVVSHAAGRLLHCCCVKLLGCWQLLQSMARGGDRNYPGGKKSGPKPDITDLGIAKRSEKLASKARTAQRKAAAAAAAVEKEEADRRRAVLREESADQPMCLRRQHGSQRIADKNAAASSSAAASAAAAPDPEAAPEPKGSIIGFLKPKAEP